MWGVGTSREGGVKAGGGGSVGGPGVWWLFALVACRAGGEVGGPLMLPPMGCNSGRGWDGGASLDWGHVGVGGTPSPHSDVTSIHLYSFSGHAITLVGRHHPTHPSGDC